MTKLKAFLIGFLLPAIALASGSVRESEHGYSSKQFFSRNYVKNYGAEENALNANASGTATVSRNTTTPIEGNGDFSITLPNNATDGVTWTIDALDPKLKNKQCELIVYFTASSIGSAVKFEVLQGSSVIASSSLLSTTSANSPMPVSVPAPCGDLTQSTTVRIQNTSGNTGTSSVNVDSVYYGEAKNVYSFAGVTATGGTESMNGAFKTHVFTSSGSLVVTGYGVVEYLIVGGGGGGGGTTSNSYHGGGGGAGGYLVGSTLVMPGTYTVTVGSGGAGASCSTGSCSSRSGTGGNSSFNTLIAYGGGGGATGGGAYSAQNGGSGAGGACGATTGGTGTSGQGNNGGTSTCASGYQAASGGGAGSAGGPGSAGSGISNSITGSAVTYAIGGDGAGGCSTQAANTGKGGSGCGGFGGYPGYAGASGIVVVRYVPLQGKYYTPMDLLPMSWSGEHGPDCSFSSSATSPSDPGGDSTCTFTERTNKNFGIVSSAQSGGNNIPGFVFTPKKTGDLFVSAVCMGGNGSSNFSKLTLTDGTATIGRSAQPTADSIYKVDGIYSVADLSQKTIKAQFSSGAGTMSISGGSSGGGYPACTWTAYYINQNTPAPVFVGGVTNGSTSTPERIERLSVTSTCSGSPCTVASKSSDWVSSVTRSSTGVYTLNINSGVFSAAPVCVGMPTGGTGGQLYGGGTMPTATAIYFNTVSTVGGAVDTRFDLFCSGPR